MHGRKNSYYDWAASDQLLRALPLLLLKLGIRMQVAVVFVSGGVVRSHVRCCHGKYLLDDLILDFIVRFISSSINSS